MAGQAHDNSVIMTGHQSLATTLGVQVNPLQQEIVVGNLFFQKVGAR
ncbi:MAG: hypothetical protein ACJ8LN_11400 [Sulfurifustis sp.]